MIHVFTWLTAPVPRLVHVTLPCALLQALLHTLAPGHEDISAFKGPGSESLAAREQAVVAALRVVNTILRLDMRFLHDTAAAMGMDRWAPWLAFSLALSLPLVLVFA